MKLVIYVAVPIHKPAEIHLNSQSSQGDFSFDTDNRFKMYKGPDPSIQFGMDDHNQWWFFASLSCSSLTDCKYARQLYELPYMKDSISLPLREKLNRYHLKISDKSFDKALAHSCMLVDDLESISPGTQSRLANIDGDDDPQISTSIHYLENLYQNKMTRFVAGEETYSFATITDNLYYFEKIHVPITGLLYLQYFVYYVNYNIIPSKQMMPRLLGNLWASKQALNTSWNRELFTIKPLVT